jgi:hypothetical protein
MVDCNTVVLAFPSDEEASLWHVCADANFPRLPRLAKVVAYHNSVPGRMGPNCAHSLALVLITVLKNLERTGDVYMRYQRPACE